MSLNIGEPALQEDIGVIANDGVDAGGLIAREDHARQDKWDHIFPAQKRFFNFGSGRGLRFLGGGGLLHFREFDIRLLAWCGSEAARRRQRRAFHGETASAATPPP